MLYIFLYHFYIRHNYYFFSLSLNNLASDQCDWPESVDCDFDPSTVNKLTKRTFLYLTFDDGPNEGTPNVLRALQVSIYSDILNIGGRE